MRGFFIAFFLLMLAAPSIFAAETQGVLRPVDLRCEYRVNPLGLDTPAPRVSWKLEAANPAARGLGQSAYRILVASSEALLMRNQGDLWDSGKVNADRVHPDTVWWQAFVVRRTRLVESPGLGQRREAVGLERACPLEHGSARGERLAREMDWPRWRARKAAGAG